MGADSSVGVKCLRCQEKVATCLVRCVQCGRGPEPRCWLCAAVELGAHVFGRVLGDGESPKR